jgi:hypothetical protein
MRKALVATLLLLMMLSNTGWSQGHTEATGEASNKIEGSSEHQAEGQEFEKKVGMTLEYEQKGCAATLGLEYYPRGTDAHVISTLKNEQCAASSGSYVLRIRYRPDEGEMGEVEFAETWSRDDDADVAVEKNYFVGENLDIRRVSSAKLKCMCTETDTEQSEMAPTSERLRHKDRE